MEINIENNIGVIITSPFIFLIIFLKLFTHNFEIIKDICYFASLKPAPYPVPIHTIFP